jgi:hypothetical protein
MIAKKNRRWHPTETRVRWYELLDRIDGLLIAAIAAALN